MEDKDMICKSLAETLKLTRNHEDLEGLYYNIDDNDHETVVIRWTGGGMRVVNVTMDSGTAMIRDIMKSID